MSSDIAAEKLAKTFDTEHEPGEKDLGVGDLNFDRRAIDKDLENGDHGVLARRATTRSSLGL